jgi:tetratricopeptide (TPR) repeat protein
MTSHGPDDAALASLAFVVLEAPQEAAFSEEATVTAIKALEAVLGRTPEEPLRAVILSNLGVLHLARFEYTSDASSLDAAVTALEAAYEAHVRYGGHPALNATIPNLINARVTRAEHTGFWEDLDEAITWGREKIVHLPREVPQRAVALAGLSSALLARYRRASRTAASAGDVTRDSDLLEAVDLARQAVADLPASHSMAGAVLSTLGRALIAGGGTEEAISVYHRAGERYRACGDRRGEARADNNLGGALVHVGRVEEAIAVYRRAVARFRELGDAKGAERVEHNLAVALGRVGEASGVRVRSAGGPLLDSASRIPTQAAHPDDSGPGST